jgi:transcriptional regulator with XRE-family HTH domain
MRTKFATWLADQMRQRDLNKTGMGHKIGISDVAIGRWLRGEREPDDVSVAKLAEFFLVSRTEIYRLLERLPDPPRDPYFEILEALWDQAPDWKKKDIVRSLRAILEEQQREQAAREARRREGASGIEEA